MDLVTSPASRALRGWSIASLAANVVIVWTGALVRLTKSGLGCDTWPQCEAGSYVPVPESGIHGLIEFGNRLLTFVLAAIAIGTFLAARRAWREGGAPKRVVWLSLGVGLGIVAQAVIGGLSVLAGLNPWVVGLHMVASVVLIVLCVVLVHGAFTLRPVPVPGRMWLLTRAVTWIGVAVLLLGPVVTGAGPNSGDGAALRSGLSLEWTAKVHAWAVWALVALTVVGLVLAWGDARLRRLWASLLVVELLQGAIGYVQYFTSLPLGLVLAHMIGTTAFVVALAHLRLLTAPASAHTTTV